MNRTPFEQALWDSGYFLSNRENDIAKHFYDAGKAAGEETPFDDDLQSERLEGFDPIEYSHPEV